MAQTAQTGGTGNTGKKSTLVLIARFFDISLKEMSVEAKALSEKDKVEMASAIARQQGLGQEDVSFGMVEY